jgi:hypothetical protein
MGMPASGRNIDVQLIDIIRFGDDGLAHEHWGIFDQMKMMQQLGPSRLLALPRHSWDGQRLAFDRAVAAISRAGETVSLKRGVHAPPSLDV